MGRVLKREVEMKWLGLLILTGVLIAGCGGGGAGPQIMSLDDVQVRVNNTVIIDLLVLAPQGDEQWSFSAPSLPDIDRYVQMTQSGPTTRFRWTPLASHVGTHQLTFTVQNSQGSDSETINIEVTSVGSTPRFIQPPTGGTFNLDENPCVDVNIEVIDEDETGVNIREGEPLVNGGQMTQDEGFRARWHWCPTQEQIDATLRYTLYLEALDSSHPLVRRPYEIVLRFEDKPDCAGDPPRIVQAAPLENPYPTERDYEIHATVTDDQGLKDNPVLHYSTEEPDRTHPDVTRMNNVTFEPIAGDEYRAYIPNLRLSAGQERTVYFVVGATDNDDTAGPRCDHTAYSAVTEFQARSGDDSTGYCEACSHDDQCRDGLCVVSLADSGTTASRSFCGAECGAGCVQGTCQRVTSRNGVTDMQCVPDGLNCTGGSGGDCTDDAYENNSDSPSTAPSYAVGTLLEGQICPGDTDYYAVNLTADTQYEVYMTGWDAAANDLDVFLQSPSGAVIGVGADIVDEENFTACADESGRHVLQIVGYGDSFGPYELAMTATGGSCCTDDIYEDNDFRAEAASISCGYGAEGTICPGDEDWWQFSAPYPMAIEVTTACDTGSGDLDLEVYDSTGTRIGRSVSGGCDEAVTATLPAAGTYYARVYGYSGATGSYLVDCEESAASTCTWSDECDTGTICDPARGCVDETCTPGVTTCPAGHFCPAPGLAGQPSACVERCTSTADCRWGYSCKIFSDGRACARTGSGQTGQSCSTFRDCASERICLNAPPTGYCAEINCVTNTDCPIDAHTAPASCVNTGSRNVCLMDCLESDTLCDINPGTCTPTYDVARGLVFVCVLPDQTVPAY